MKILNPDLLKAALAPNAPKVKFLLNGSEIAFLPVSIQHRDIKPGGLSYEDDHCGNALAGLVVGGRPEIRFHAGFSDERVRYIWRGFIACPECAGFSIPNRTYQGSAVF